MTCCQSLKRGTTWVLPFSITESDGVTLRDLNGYTILLTIKDRKTVASDDSGATYVDSQVISTSVTSVTFTVPAADTFITPGKQSYGFRYTKAGVTNTVDSTFIVCDTTTNRLT